MTTRSYNDLVSEIQIVESSLCHLTSHEIDKELMKRFELTRSDLLELRGIKDQLDFID